MKHRISHRSRIAASVGAVLLGSLMAAGSALGIAPPDNVATSNARSDQGPWTFTWTAPEPDLGDTVTGYVGGPTGSATDAPTTVIASGEAVGVPETAAFFRVAAVQATGGIGAYATLPIAPDYTAPSFDITLTPAAPNAADWYRTLTINRDPCADAGGLPPNSCGPIAPVAGDNATAPVSLTDLAGHTTPATIPAYKYDPTPPAAGTGVPLQPGTNALVAAEPAFTWNPGVDPLSGVARYELQYKAAADDEWIAIATVPDTGGVGDYTARRDGGAPLPEKTLLEWRVRTFDKAGNVRNSVAQRLTIDSTVPPAPTITGGPAAPTQSTSPTFTWTGTEQTYLWDLTLAGTQNPIRRGAGPAGEATLQSLPDGDYVFRVTQVTDAGRESAEATRTFKVDTTPPAPPTILVRPSFPAVTAPVFTWSTEPGAYSRWMLLDAAGTPIVGPSDTPATSVTLPALAEASYTFQVQQIDAAGNVSPTTSEPFTVLASLSPAPAPSATTSIVNLLPRQNAMRLRPKAGRTVPTRSPVLQWKRGPRGTRLYNLQIFKVTKIRGAKAPKITKVLSRFPKGLQYRTPKKALQAGTCYVWRVWPYTGRAFTPKPIGVSNFCVAGTKVLKKKAAQAAARKRIAARSLRARS